MERIRTRPIATIEPEEWFTEDIMWQVTRFKTFQEFLRKSKTRARTVKDLDNLADSKSFNAFVAENSQFPNWQALRDYAKHKFFGYI